MATLTTNEVIAKMKKYIQPNPENTEGASELTHLLLNGKVYTMHGEQGLPGEPGADGKDATQFFEYNSSTKTLTVKL